MEQSLGSKSEFRFKAKQITKPHKLILDNRKRTNLTGIEDVVEFDTTQIVLESSMGMLVIKGADLKITRLSIEKGEADIDGSVDSVIYSQIKNYGEKGKSVLKRMFS